MSAWPVQDWKKPEVYKKNQVFGFLNSFFVFLDF